MEIKNTKDMTDKEFVERFFKAMSEPVEGAESLNIETLKKVSSIRKNAEELVKKTSTTQILKESKISVQDDEWHIKLSISHKDGMQQAYFLSDRLGLKDESGLEQLRNIFNTADHITFKVKSDKRFELSAYVYGIWNIK